MPYMEKFPSDFRLVISGPGGQTSQTGANRLENESEKNRNVHSFN